MSSMTEKSTAGAEAQLNILDRTAGISENTNTTPSSTKILIPMAIIKLPTNTPNTFNIFFIISYIYN